jgi:hypothetical protein
VGLIASQYSSGEGSGLESRVKGWVLDRIERLNQNGGIFMKKRAGKLSHGVVSWGLCRRVQGLAAYAF